MVDYAISKTYPKKLGVYMLIDLIVMNHVKNLVDNFALERGPEGICDWPSPPAVSPCSPGCVIPGKTPQKKQTMIYY